VPDREVVVDDDRIVDAEVGDGVADVVEVVLEVELGRVHADDDEPGRGVLLRPRPDVRQRPQPVDAGVRPEVDRDDAPVQRVGGQRLGVEPGGRPVERRERAVHGTGDGHGAG
jgi:hypothetical protein